MFGAPYDMKKNTKSEIYNVSIFWASRALREFFVWSFESEVWMEYKGKESTVKILFIFYILSLLTDVTTTLGEYLISNDIVDAIIRCF